MTGVFVITLLLGSFMQMKNTWRTAFGREFRNITAEYGSTCNKKLTGFLTGRDEDGYFLGFRSLFFRKGKMTCRCNRQ